MDKVRNSFVEFFEKNGHTFWKSAPCVPLDDPTLLFVNAGMNQFKPLFLGTCDPNHPMSGMKRATNSQKCIRAGGKHNDLEDVGKDVYHHTFFEMLGNWSFGDYFKEEAIEMAWRCLTEKFKLDPERMYATFFEGDEDSPRDVEAEQIWLKYLPRERVIACCAKDNFWEMGATGPCGPCTEIHYDRIGGRICPELVNADLPDVIEIWNNVFIQFNRENDGSLRTLPDQHVDTGMGFERLTSILQNVDSNYDTDIFVPIFDAIHKTIVETNPDLQVYGGLVGEPDKAQGYRDMAYRVIADHLRTLSFSIADGAVPSNDGRGYVLRRILRRAVRYGRQNLGAEIGFFSKLVPTLVKLMGHTFTELADKEAFVVQIIAEEEISFGKTLDKGLAKFSSVAESLDAKKFPSDAVHLLYTTHGFPIDLTSLMAEEQGLIVDEDEVNELMENERELSRKARLAKLAEGKGSKDLSVSAEQTSHLEKELKLATTNDDFKYFLDDLVEYSLKAKVQAIYHSREVGFVDSCSVDSEMVGLVLDRTSFYSESGGQIFDTGLITGGDSVFEVHDVQCYAGFVLHIGKILSKGSGINVTDEILCKPNLSRRSDIAKNHTLTHVLNLALRNTLIKPDSDATIGQKGSFLDETKLRFDFSFGKALTTSQLKSVEDHCQSVIDENLTVYTEVSDLKEAMNIATLRAVFGEVYPEKVRVVSVGAPVDEVLKDPHNAQYWENSIEFCGGTHLKNTGAAASFCLLNEEGIAKGVRRITACTGQVADEAIALGNNLKCEVDKAGNLEGEELDTAIKTLTASVNEADMSAALKAELRDTLQVYSKKLVTFKKAQEKKIISEVLNDVGETVACGKSSVVYRKDFGINGKLSKAILTGVQKKYKSCNMMLVSADSEDKKLFLGAMAAANKDQARDCQEWLKSAMGGYEGRGGGKKNAAQYTLEAPSNESLDSMISNIIQNAN